MSLYFILPDKKNIDLQMRHIGKHLESEGNDRADISLPAGQLQLMKDATSAASTGSYMHDK